MFKAVWKFLTGRRRGSRVLPFRDTIDADASSCAGKAGTIQWILDGATKADLITRLTALDRAQEAVEDLAGMVNRLVAAERKRVSEL